MIKFFNPLNTDTSAGIKIQSFSILLNIYTWYKFNQVMCLNIRIALTLFLISLPSLLIQMSVFLEETISYFHKFLLGRNSQLFKVRAYFKLMRIQKHHGDLYLWFILLSDSLWISVLFLSGNQVLRNLFLDWTTTFVHQFSISFGHIALKHLEQSKKYLK